jgi:uroporphyrinogen decarboxylase
LEWEVDAAVIESLCPGCDLFDFVDRLDLDGVVVSPDYLTEPISTHLYRDEWGVVRQKGRESYAMPLEKHAPLDSFADLRNYEPPPAVLPRRFETLRRAVERFKGRRAIVFKVRDGFSTPRDLRGYSAFLMDTLLEPEMVRELVGISIQHNVAVACEAIRLGADAVVSGDDYADSKGPLVSPAVFAELFLPAIRQLADAVHRAGAYYIKHSDGNLRPLLDPLVEAGIDCLDPIDPVAGMDIRSIKNVYGSRIALKGNIDCAGLLSFGSPREVAAAVRRCIRDASPAGGHILSSSNSIHSGVKPENYRAMLETLWEFGRYPLQLKPKEGTA